MRRRVWAGMRSLGMQPLDAADRAHLVARIRDQRLRFFAFGFAVPLTFAAGIALLPLLPQPFSLVGCFGVGLVGATAMGLASSDAWARRRKLARDLARAEVEVFEGRPGVAEQPDDALRTLVTQGALTVERATHRVQVFPASGLVHAVDGARRADFLVPDVLEVAEARAVARTMGEPDVPLVLTEDERLELRDRASQWWRTPGAIVFAVVYFGVGVLSVRFIPTPVAWGRWVQLCIAGVFAVGGVIAMAQRVRIAVLLAQDALHGAAVDRVVVDDDGVMHRAVILDRSGLFWSVDGRPAEWRSKRT